MLIAVIDTHSRMHIIIVTKSNKLIYSLAHRYGHTKLTNSLNYTT